MNACFYSAISRLPLGTVSAIEFLPVIALAAIGVRSSRNLLALALAVGGVDPLTDIRLAGATLGFAFAFANAVLFLLNIVLADRVAKRAALSGIDGLAAAMLIAAVVVTPIGGWQAVRHSETRSRCWPASGSASLPRSSRTRPTSWQWPGCRAPPTPPWSRCCRRWPP